MLQERKLKSELMGISDKYSEVCKEKERIEGELNSLKENSIDKAEHLKVLLFYK